MAEKIHFRQADVPQGCFCHPPFTGVSFLHHTLVKPSYQFSTPARVLQLVKHAINRHLYVILSFLYPLYPNLKKKYIGSHTIPLDTISRSSSRFFTLSQKNSCSFRQEVHYFKSKYLRLFPACRGWLFFLFDYRHVEQNAHWRTLVVTQQ